MIYKKIFWRYMICEKTANCRRYFLDASSHLYKRSCLSVGPSRKRLNRLIRDSFIQKAAPTYSLTHSFTDSFIFSFIYSFICTFIHSFIYSLIHKQHLFIEKVHSEKTFIHRGRIVGLFGLVSLIFFFHFLIFFLPSFDSFRSFI